MRDELLRLGWIPRGEWLVRYSSPRLGWKDDGTLIIGYHEHPEKVYTLERLNEILKESADG